MHWLYLFLAIIAETLGTTFLKMSNGFTQLFPSILAIALFCLALFLSEITLKYGTENESPKELELSNLGIKNPDCLFTVGSG